MTDFGARLIQRLNEAVGRNEQIFSQNEKAKQRLKKVLPDLSKNLQGNDVYLRALAEIYSAMQTDGEVLQGNIIELKEAIVSLEFATNLLEQAGYDMANIQTFSKDEIWLGDHLDTIKRFVEIVNLQKLEVALDEADKERFEDIAHAVKRSGEKRQNIHETDTLREHLRLTQDEAAAAAALIAIDAIKVATALISDDPSGELKEDESGDKGD